MSRLRIAPAVSLKGVRGEMSVVFREAPESFAHHLYDCVLTSCVRPQHPKSLHGYGLAADFDSTLDVPESQGILIARDLQDYIGGEYYCLWHRADGGEWHLHVEFDPENKGVKPYLVA